MKTWIEVISLAIHIESNQLFPVLQLCMLQDWALVCKQLVIQLAFFFYFLSFFCELVIKIQSAMFCLFLAFIVFHRTLPPPPFLNSRF